MSTKTVMDFVEHVAGSSDLEKEFDAIVQSTKDNAQRMSEFGSKHGFDFSAEEFVHVTQAVLEVSGGELNEEELAEVSGGAGTAAASTAMATGTLLPNSVAVQINTIQRLP